MEEGKITKLEVKVGGKPKPKIKWLKEKEEIIPSEEYQIENLDDGTSILVITNVYPDDTFGLITFEAHNAYGVAKTTTELSVTGTLTEEKYFKVLNFNYFFKDNFNFQHYLPIVYLSYSYCPFDKRK